MSTADKIKNVVRDEVSTITTISKNAAESGTYIYPIRGISYYLMHRSLWRPLLTHLLPMIFLSGTILAAMFVFTYIPQVAIMALVDGPVAIINTVLLVLSESATLILFISRLWWLDDAVLEIFDAVLVNEGATALVANGREINSASSARGDPLARLGKRMNKLRSFRENPFKALIRYLMLFPLNFIPVVGTAVFLVLQGRKQGPASHARYFQLKKFSEEEKDAHIKRNEGGYVSFGTMCMVLNLLPMANIAFVFTNAVGAALWAADMEKKQKDGQKKST